MSIEAVRSKFFGGRVCLDFANTLNWRLTDAPVELIPDYAALLDWSEKRGTLSRATIAKLKKKSGSPEAVKFMAEIHALRGAMISSADALQGSTHADVKFLNRALQGLPPQPKLVNEDGRYVFDLDGTDIRQPLWPVLWSLTAVLASSDADRIGSCQAEGCGWFFVDESPNHTRMWCSDGCGNRERVRRAYAKKRATPA